MERFQFGSKAVFIVGVGALVYWLVKKRHREALVASTGLYVLYGADKMHWLRVASTFLVEAGQRFIAGI